MRGARTATVNSPRHTRQQHFGSPESVYQLLTYLHPERRNLTKGVLHLNSWHGCPRPTPDLSLRHRCHVLPTDDAAHPERPGVAASPTKLKYHSRRVRVSTS